MSASAYSVAAATDSGPRPPCRLCGSVETLVWRAGSHAGRLVPEDLRITDDRYGITPRLHRCRKCQFVFAEGIETKDLTACYERLRDPAYEESLPGRSRQMRWLIGEGLRACPGATSVLDVGAAAGALVAEARRRDLQATGIEPSRALVEAARRVHQVELLQGTLPHPDLDEARFDLVFLIDVIEHVMRPLELLRHCVAHLAPRGALVLVTPDVGSLAAWLLGRRWWHFRLAHVGYFNRQSLGFAARSSGLRMLSSGRARWFFSLGYLLERMQRYMPVGPAYRALAGSRWGARLCRVVVPLNLFDSFLVILVRTGPS